MCIEQTDIDGVSKVVDGTLHSSSAVGAVELDSEQWAGLGDVSPD